jgi:nitrate/nitrite-specific signal transduction histidine kinase
MMERQSMTETQKPVRAGRMLGPFALILIIALLLIGLSVGVTVLISFEAGFVYNQTERHTQLQLAQYYLLDTEVLVREAMYYPEPDDQASIIAEHEENMASLDEALADLESVSEDHDLAAIAAIREYKDTLTGNLNETLAAAAAGEASTDLVETMSDDEHAINADMDALVFDARAALTRARGDLNWAREIALAIAITVLVLFPLLAVWAYFLASRFTEPMLQIDNAVMAAGGKTYRESLVAGALRRRDGIGQLARAVDSMAQSLGAQNAALEQEIAQSRQQLNDTRRRKLSQN